MSNDYYNDISYIVMDFYILLNTSKDREKGSAVESNEVASWQSAVTAKDENSKDATMVSMKQPMKMYTTAPSYIIVC